MAVKDDRKLLESLVKKYGREDVEKFIEKIENRKINEGGFDDFRANCRFWIQELKNKGNVTVTFDNPEMADERLNHFLLICKEAGLYPKCGAKTVDRNGNQQRVVYIEK